MAWNRRIQRRKHGSFMLDFFFVSTSVTAWTETEHVWVLDIKKAGCPGG